jgi:hypothetical protein
MRASGADWGSAKNAAAPMHPSREARHPAPLYHSAGALCSGPRGSGGCSVMG